MQKYNDVVLDVKGNVVPTASITVTDLNGGAVNVYNVNNTVTPKTQPFTPNSLGEFSFYAPDGRYNVVVSYAGVTYTISDILFNDPTTSLSGPTGASLVGFIQGGAGAVPRTLLQKLLDSPVSFRDFGAKMDGVTDDAAAVRLAFATGRPIEDYGSCYIGSTVNVPAGTRIKGKLTYEVNQPPNSDLTFVFAAGIVGFQAPATNAGYEALNWSFEGLTFSGGLTQVSLPNGGVAWTMKNVVFSGPSGSCIKAFGYKQDWYFDNIVFSYGTYGINCPNTVGTAGTPTQMDKCSFKDIYLQGQTINGAYISCLLSNSVTWINLKIVHIAQDGMVIDGGMRYWLFDNISTEGAAGYTGSPSLNPTTGSITAGTNALVVANATGLAIGQTLTIAGAGPSGIDLSSNITNLVGTAVTLFDNASTTVTGAEVINHVYSQIKFTSTSGAPAEIQFVGGSLPSLNSAAGDKYSIDASGVGGDLYILGLFTNRPIYDPNRAVSGMAGAFDYRGGGLAIDTFERFNVGVGFDKARLPSPPGRDLLLGLQDSARNGSGTFGNFELRRHDSNRTRMMYLSGTTGEFSVLGAITLSQQYPTYGPVISINSATGNEFTINVTNTTPFTISDPSTYSDGRRLTITIKNTSGGVMGAITWGASYKMSAWTNPANGFSRSIEFSHDGLGSGWVERSRTAADVPN